MTLPGPGAVAVFGALEQPTARVVVLTSTGDRAERAFRHLCASAPDDVKPVDGRRRLRRGPAIVDVFSASDALMRHAPPPTALLVGQGAGGIVVDAMKRGNPTILEPVAG